MIGTTPEHDFGPTKPILNDKCKQLPIPCSVLGGPNTTWMLLQQPCRASLSEPHCIHPLVAMAHPEPLAQPV